MREYIEARAAGSGKLPTVRQVEQAVGGSRTTITQELRAHRHLVEPVLLGDDPWNACQKLTRQLETLREIAAVLGQRLVFAIDTDPNARWDSFLVDGMRWVPGTFEGVTMESADDKVARETAATASELGEVDDDGVEPAQRDWVRSSRKLTIRHAAERAGISEEALYSRIRRAKGRREWCPFIKTVLGWHASEQDFDAWVKTWTGRHKLRRARSLASPGVRGAD